jgi:hypothetical protein
VPFMHAGVDLRIGIPSFSTFTSSELSRQGCKQVECCMQTTAAAVAINLPMRHGTAPQCLPSIQDGTRFKFAQIITGEQHWLTVPDVLGAGPATALCPRPRAEASAHRCAASCMQAPRALSAVNSSMRKAPTEVAVQFCSVVLVCQHSCC